MDAAEAVDKWLADGMSGELPVDLWKYGIRFPEVALAGQAAQVASESVTVAEPSTSTPPVEPPSARTGSNSDMRLCNKAVWPTRLIGTIA